MIFKTKGLLRTKLYFLKLDELVKKIPRKVCSMSNSQKKHQHPTLNTTPTRKKTQIPLTMISWDRQKFHQFPIF